MPVPGYYNLFPARCSYEFALVVRTLFVRCSYAARTSSHERELTRELRDAPVWARDKGEGAPKKGGFPEDKHKGDENKTPALQVPFTRFYSSLSFCVNANVKLAPRPRATEGDLRHEAFLCFSERLAQYFHFLLLLLEPLLHFTMKQLLLLKQHACRRPIRGVGHHRQLYDLLHFRGSISQGQKLAFTKGYPTRTLRRQFFPANYLVDCAAQTENVALGQVDQRLLE